MKIKDRILKFLDVTGFNAFEPLVRLATWDDPQAQFRKILLYLATPVLAFVIFLGLWQAVAKNIQTKYGTVPTPAEVWQQGGALLSAHFQSRQEQREFYAQQREKAQEFREKAAQYAAAARADSTPESKRAAYAKHAEIYRKRAEAHATAKHSASPTYLDQIVTSLQTVFAGFVIASLIAVPIGIICGLNKICMAALNPLIQIFKPVSPLAWLPIVMILVGALYTTDPEQAWFEKSFISSAITVALCSLWPTLVNTALGVSSIDKDHLNVAKVLRLGPITTLFKIVIPSALPLIFTGLRISLGVGWMVLIAAEMLAQNPGLGKFVWDMFQNGSSQTLAQIMVAVFTIGVIGFMLDRIMIVMQRSVSFDEVVSA
jgi:nitrate/nitrite transport system permease protein